MACRGVNGQPHIRRQRLRAKQHAFPNSVGDKEQECADPIFYKSGSDQLIEYAYLTP